MFIKRTVFGDVVAIYNNAGGKVAGYRYNAYGECYIYNPELTANSNGSTIAEINPFRYRGYYYDTESGLYYLQSRYYDPAMGRFLNADTVDYIDPESINGINLYAYALNNPVLFSDPSGNFVLSTMLVAGLISAAVSGVINVISQVSQEKEFDTVDLLKNMAGGFISGFISAGAAGIVSTIALGALGSVAGGIVSGSVTDVGSGVIAAGLGAGAGILMKGLGCLRVFAKSKSINSLSSKSRSSSINNMLIKMNATPVDLSHNTFGKWSVNIFKSMSGKQVKNIVGDFMKKSNTYLGASGATLMSGWYKNGY